MPDLWWTPPRLPATWLALAGLLALGLGGLRGLWPAADPAVAWNAATASTEAVTLSAWLPDRAELLDPRTRLPHFHTLPITPLRSVLAGTHPGGDHPALRKLATWVAHSHGQPLPDGFFDRPPWMHPSGHSYAALANQPGPRHITEAPPAGPLGTTTAATRTALVAGHTRVVGAHWVLLPDRPGTLHATPRAHFDDVLARHGRRYQTCTTPSSRCLSPTPRPGAAGFVGLGALLLVSALGLLVHRTHTLRRRASADRAFVLRTLTHELRTPATAIGLQLDRLRRQYDQLPEEGQDAFLGLVSANQRLRCTLDATARFLEVEQGSVPLEPTALDLHTLFDGAEVPVDGTAQVRTDARWAAIAVGNLIANAHQHGAPPVAVRVRAVADGAVVDVTDGGPLTDPLATLGRPFERGPDSEGLGLGLALTGRIAQMLGDGLTLTVSPTCFSIHLRDLP